MTSSLLQFHAAPDELISELIPRWTADLNLHAAVEILGNPYRVRGYTNAPSDLPTPGWFRFVYSATPFDVDFHQIVNPRSLHDRFPDRLSLTCGRLLPGGLAQSLLGFVTSEAVSSNLWRIVLRRAKQSLVHGDVLIVQPELGRQNRARAWYSDGATQLSSHGVRLLLTGPGGNYYQVSPADQPI